MRKGKAPEQARPKPETPKPKGINKRQLLIAGLAAAIVLLITWLVYLPSLDNGFTNWDDPKYVVDNPMIRSLDKENRSRMWEEPVMLNYHPLTMLSLAWDYQHAWDEEAKELAPRPFHRTNLILHLLNCLLVFLFVYLLARRRWVVAAITALLFGIHPMHVESVAWVAERKDVLYTFFFMLSLVAYYYYTEMLRYRKYLLAVPLFLVAGFLFYASVLSKAMAVILPLVMLAVDYYRHRKDVWLAIGEKLPLLYIAWHFGQKAVEIQSAGAITAFKSIALGTRLQIASYGFIEYIEKLFVPIGLSTYYPYPWSDPANYTLPGWFGWYLAGFMVIMLALIAMGVFSLLGRSKKWFRPVVFGGFFYFITVALVLQFISVGRVIIADRYTYIPYIGLFFLLALAFANLWQRKKLPRAAKLVMLTLLAGWTLWLTGRTVQRIGVWENSYLLWTDVIEQFPKKSDVAYKNRGKYMALHMGRYEDALNDYRVLVTLRQDAEIFSNYGNIYVLRGDSAMKAKNRDVAMDNYQKAVQKYSRAIDFKPGFFDTYVNRGLTYQKMGEPAKAVTDFDKALQIRPGLLHVIDSRGRALYDAGQHERALQDFTLILNQQPGNVQLRLIRGVSYFQTGNFRAAEQDLKQVIGKQPANAHAHYYLSYTYEKMGQFRPALQHAKKAKELGLPVKADYLNRLRSAAGQ